MEPLTAEDIKRSRLNYVWKNQETISHLVGLMEEEEKEVGRELLEIFIGVVFLQGQSEALTIAKSLEVKK